jgi:serine/threonine protein kinase
MCAGFYDDTLVKEMLKECVKMLQFDHPNVLSLIGVCVDGGTAPYIVMPFMANGSLHLYLKKFRSDLLLPDDYPNEEVSTLPIT